MMGSSSAIDDELAEIESGSAVFVFSKCSIENNCGEPSSMTDNHHSTTAAIEQGTSSIMGPVDTIEEQDSYDNGDLLVTFPIRADTDGYNSTNNGRGNNCLAGQPSSDPAKQRNSISVNPMAMRDALAGLSDLVDSDDSDDEDLKPTANRLAIGYAQGVRDRWDMSKNRNNNRMASAPQPQQPAGLKNPHGSGGPEHRPLVGGFAAAAYEAARVDYYKKLGKDVRGHVVINSPASRSRPRQHGQA